jgi:uncharacterized protein
MARARRRDNFEAWALSAYGDHLEQLQPGNRQRTAEMGAPGFEDVVASIEPARVSRSRDRTKWGRAFDELMVGAVPADAYPPSSQLALAVIDEPTLDQDPAEAPEWDA